MSEPYNETVRQLFAEPGHSGDAGGGPEPVVSVRVGSAAQGAELMLSVSADQLAFRAYGCPHLLAACELVCREWSAGELTSLTMVDRQRLMDMLEVPVEKTGVMLLLEDALAALDAKLGKTRK